MSNAVAFSQLLRLGLSFQALAGSRAIKRRLSRNLAAFGLMLFAALLLAGALAFGLGALWLHLRPMIGSPMACLALAGLLIALAFVLMAFARNLVKGKRRTQNAPPAQLAILAQVEKTIGDRKGLFLLAALMAGAVAGGSR